MPAGKGADVEIDGDESGMSNSAVTGISGDNTASVSDTCAGTHAPGIGVPHPAAAHSGCKCRESDSSARPGQLMLPGTTH